MRIVYVSNNNPFNINNWSGTPHHLISALRKHHEIVWIGGGVINGASWHHRFLHNHKRFNVLDYIPDICRMVSDDINCNNFDAVISATYSMCSELDIDIPLIAFCDLTYSLCTKYLKRSVPQMKDRCMREEEKFLRSAGAVIYSSDFARKSAISDYNIPSDKISVIDFGANIPEPVDVEVSSFSRDICKLTFVGRNWEKKGGPKVLEAFRLLKRQGFPCELTIIGCKPPIEINDEGLEVIPWLDKSNIADLVRYDIILRNSHFMVLPTVFDAYGIVFCEASAYGVPSIAANVGGVSQPICDGKNGYLLSPDATPQDYADKIRDTFMDEKKYCQLRQSSRLEYETRLNWDRWADKVTGIIEGLVEKKVQRTTCHIEHFEDKKIQKIGNEFYIPVYAFNLKSRPDRLKNLQRQFSGKEEFRVTYMEAVQHEIGAVGLWLSICEAVKLARYRGEDLIVLCEDDHVFTEAYNPDYLLSNIAAAHVQGAELLNGGIGGFGTAVPVAQNRCCVDWFWCTQFVIIYSSLFQKILDYNFKTGDTADGVLSALAKNPQVMFPSISTQYDFGYSDIKPRPKDFQDRIFSTSNRRLAEIQKIYQNVVEKRK